MSLLKQVSINVAKIGQFWQEKANGRVFRWNLAFILIQFAYVWYKYGDLPSEIPLFYSRPWGSEQLANSTYILFPPVFSLVIMLLNTLMAVFYLRSHSLLSRLLITTSLVFSALSLVAVIRSIGLVA
jgi:hypothetical protein